MLIFVLGCELYIFLFTLAMSSVSANILLRLRQGDLTDRELNAIYDSASMLDLRLSRLLQAQFVTQIDQQFEATARGRRLVGFFDLLRRLFRLS